MDETIRLGSAAPGWRPQMKAFIVFVVVLCGCFAAPLYMLGRYALHSDFFSYIPLIPIISIYLVRMKRDELPETVAGFSVGGAVAALAGIGLLAGWVALHSGFEVESPNFLTFMTAAFVSFVIAGSFMILGPAYTRAIAFPLGFLVFMVPMPQEMLDNVEYFFQLTSAATSAAFLKMAGMHVVRTDTYLDLPTNFEIVVAPECSGIHSTMVLLMTSFLAGYLFLRTTSRRLAMVLLVVPLAIARNGFRVFVISELCVQINHEMIHSFIHQNGGPIFFALSLIPFFALLLWLRKSELRKEKSADESIKA